MNNHPVFSGPFDSDSSSLPSSVGVEISLQFNTCILIYRVLLPFWTGHVLTLFSQVFKFSFLESMLPKCHYSSGRHKSLRYC
jgi:hypothetical protein